MLRFYSSFNLRNNIYIGLACSAFRSVCLPDLIPLLNSVGTSIHRLFMRQRAPLSRQIKCYTPLCPTDSKTQCLLSLFSYFLVTLGLFWSLVCRYFVIGHRSFWSAFVVILAYFFQLFASLFWSLSTIYDCHVFYWSFLSLYGHSMSLDWALWPVGSLGQCPVCPFVNPSMLALSQHPQPASPLSHVSLALFELTTGFLIILDYLLPFWTVSCCWPRCGLCLLLFPAWCLTALKLIWLLPDCLLVMSTGLLNL